ncbi:uroporphyrinogen decarboxylase [Ichthyenterobacterium sp. W332]|uniref:Uroporphyrinogen decarboxylase n=1 Tax=Microcosmobacter mediterraneus TaxID=3075607 RepID=A0ABU2YM65_9FLAO|nr:uroporphyrinogen decarboxylase [Ichthyenterobacterium sp. W332]MDT0559250.1 uroporphyrinogen decarboxylase [Ichthyenterobacterium sp. W332]
MEFFGVSVTEWVGYLASAVLLISFMMKDVNKLRIVNSCGAVLFVIYGVMLLTSWPIIITNSAIIGINLYYILKKN